MFIVAGLVGYFVARFIPGATGDVLGVLAGLAVVLDIAPRFPVQEVKN